MRSDSLSLNGTLYANVTPAGAFYAVSNRENNASRMLLSSILKEGSKVPLTEDTLLQWSGCADIETALSLLFRLQRLEFVYGTETPNEINEQNLEVRLPDILKKLSDTGRTLLADGDGLYYAGAGFHHESAEEIAALAGDMVSLSERHGLLLKNNLNLSPNAWSLCDPTGQSELAFFSLFFNNNAFVLVIGGVPQLQGEAFVELVEILYRRYGG
ncbi:peptidase M23 [Neisseria sp. Ec49-e6-T10]|uniref:peptidase M23 n=1 Tax=Neisseria sp. Ec49-e6-T10 TaxID=3140744 RepID=UPI003EBFF1ED